MVKQFTHCLPQEPREALEECLLPKHSHGTLIPSAQRIGWAAKQRLWNAALGALFA